MFNKKKLYWFSQLIGWLLYVVVVGVLNKLNGSDLTAPLLYNLLSIFILGIFISHLYRSVILRLNWMRFNIPRLIPRGVLGAMVFGVIFYFLQYLVSEILIAGGTFEFDFIKALPVIINWTLLCVLWSALYFLFHFIDNYKKEEIKNLKWEAAKNEMELNKLKSQLNPHFIFNSMNSIRALINEDPKLAKDAITQLSNVLRNSLMIGRKKVISLNEEMKLVDDYLSLEKTRFEERLNIVRNISDETLNFQVPPLMVQTLVENGIKHGTSKLPGGGTIEITSELENDRLKITIKNSGKYDQVTESDSGFGIINTVQRLQLLYGNEASFNITNEDGMVKTQLVVPKETIL